MKRWQQLKNNPSLLQPLKIREHVIDQVRSFFKAKDFWEVETPQLVASPGTEPYLEVFATELKRANGSKYPGYLLTSPEYALKKLIAAGLPRVFQIGKSLRNEEGQSGKHNPEFTMIEWYRTQADYTDVMVDCEGLFRSIATFLHQLEPAKYPSKDVLAYQGMEYQLAKPWPRLKIAELFARYAEITTEQLVSDELVTIAQQRGHAITNPGTAWDDAFFGILLKEIEPELKKLRQPFFLCDYPLQQAALSKTCAYDPRFAERFELYVGELEIANSFSELTDAAEQRRRLEAELELRQQLGKTKYQLDEDFITALESGLPPTGGIALGIDRLAMLFANVATLQEVLFFPIEDVFNLE